ncbi:hypothetical protein J5N97_016796 [Dioscorea zingiberensis]|uniref:Uncharacterized protein n=1 Tax=Dioscorea zingiberensis TaxID=325984 RepID=A0A9D5CK77_9LILI|nr:hypothetical protein J5N97_016796 [Dioscorea zingiberensis]
MESIIAKALEYTLKYWLKSFSRDQFKLQGRTAQLYNLVLACLRLLNVSTARVGKLEIMLPSVSYMCKTEPIVVQIDKLDVVLEENVDSENSRSSCSAQSSTCSSPKGSGYGFADKVERVMFICAPTEAAGRSIVSIVIDHIFLCIKDADFRLELLMQSLLFFRASVSNGRRCKELVLAIMVGGLFQVKKSSMDWSAGLWQCIESARDLLRKAALWSLHDGGPLLNVPPEEGVVRIGVDFVSNFLLMLQKLDQLFFCSDISMPTLVES